MKLASQPPDRGSGALDFGGEKEHPSGILIICVCLLRVANQ